MQRAAKSPVLLPTLLEEIFGRFSSSTPGDLNNIENLLLDLHKILGRRLVPAALHTLDNQTIVIYTSNPKLIEIAEISEADTPFRLLRLFVQINYCTCEYFKEKVLNKTTSYIGPYTCQHVLAVRLAIALQHKCLQYKEIPSHKLDLLLNDFLTGNSEAE